MQLETAQRLITWLVELGEEVHRPIEGGLPNEIGVDEAKIIHQSIGDVMGLVYTDLMIPVLRRYPSLDPDREKDAPRTGLAPRQPAASRAELGAAIATTAEACRQRLHQILRQFGDEVEELETRRLEITLEQVVEIGRALGDRTKVLRYQRC